MMVMMMAMTPSLNGSSRPVFMAAARVGYHNEMRAYLTLLTASALAMARPVCAAAPQPPSVDRDLARDMLKSLVKINSTHEHGSTAAAQAIRGWLESAGYPPSDVVFIAPPEHPTKGSVVV